jgi:ribosomal protein S1
MFMLAFTLGSRAADPPLEKDRLTELAGQVGKQFDGKVNSIVERGAFVDVGGAEGFVHVDQMGWTGEKDPKKLVKVGQAVKVTVLLVNVEKKEINFSMRRDEEDPWRKVPGKYPLDGKAKAKVGQVVKAGVFLVLEPYVEVLVLESDLPEGKTKADYKPGQEVEVKITYLNAEKRRIAGSMR